ncbi:MFS transporter, putative [Cordyceps militaris CM01]|uniref:MFS transporter, putative n=1 Tax=Cordyceps militaris (strain CM01) TaxID=983644 RepID=G3J4K3_CORMM|nr:MFS transporter, putative [Cordyceps militaris CM01]EGX95873.1 MFS transporter, putative [Cordyceps militaris CM01]
MSTTEQPHPEKSFEVNERLPSSSSPSTSDHVAAQKQLPTADKTAAVTVQHGDVDAAWLFLDQHRDVPGVDTVDLKKLRRRIDLRIVPIMFGCYTMQFLDKVIYNYAAVMGIKKDLDLTGNRFSNVATFLFVGLLCFEIPNIYLLQRVPAAKWLGLNVTLWGVATACGAAAHNYPSILASRIFLGIFEATIAPSLALISSQWYTKSEQAPRFSFWYLGLGVGQIVGGVLSYAFQHVSPTASLAGWRVMFVVLGCVTVLIGLSVIALIPDTPMQARWMSVTEKVALLKHVSVNQTGIRNSRFRAAELLEGLMDLQIWLQILITVLFSVSSGVITTYSVMLIGQITHDANKTPAQNSQHAALMNTPSGAVSIFFILMIGYGVRRNAHRWMWILACIIPAIVGGALMSFLPKTNHAGLLAGVYLVNAVVAPMPMQYNWLLANVAGATKRAYSVAMISAAFSIGNIIGPQTFQARDAPDYRPAKLALVFTQAGSALVTITLFGYYVWANKRRAVRARQTEDQFMDKEVWTRMTDKENPTFRYEY